MLIHWAHAIRDEARDDLRAHQIAVMALAEMKPNVRTRWMTSLSRIAEAGVKAGDVLNGIGTTEGRLRYIGTCLSAFTAEQWRTLNESALLWLAQAGFTEADAIAEHARWKEHVHKMKTQQQGVSLTEWASTRPAVQEWARSEMIEVDEDGNVIE